MKELGIKESDEICVVECKFQNGNETLYKSKIGRAIKLSEGFSETAKDYKGCAGYFLPVPINLTVETTAQASLRMIFAENFGCLQ